MLTREYQQVSAAEGINDVETGRSSEAAGKAIGVAPETTVQTARQVTVAIAATFTLRVRRQVTIRVGVTLHLGIGCGIGVRTTVNVALQTGPRIRSHTPSRVTFRTTSRTVPGTVPGAIPAASLSTGFAVYLNLLQLLRLRATENG